MSRLIGPQGPSIFRAARLGVLLSVILVAASAVRAAEPENCHVATYRMADGGFIDIAPSSGDTLRWRRFDGTTGALTKAQDSWTSTLGWTERPDGKTVRFTDCDHVEFAGMSGSRIALGTTDATFESHGTELAGRLVMPQGRGIVPIVVLVHGSEHDSALKYYALQRMLPAEGIGVFVFDKRGTGISGGTYTQDFSLLADDDIAAMREAKKLSGPRAGRIGYQGGSEAGWVVPIAVNRVPVDFAIVSFGLAVSVIDEDQQEVEIEMREEGHSSAEIADALKVARAAENLIADGFTKGFEEFDAVRAKYRHASWYKDLHGDFTYMLLPLTKAQMQAMAPKFDWHTPFRYDPMPTLHADTVPQLWVLGTEDYEAPSRITSQRILSLIANGKPYTLALYPGAEHGMTLFEKDARGERQSTRFAPGYFKMMADFIRDGRLSGAYGNAGIAQPASH